VQAQREASTDAFHLAMFIAALLLAAGAATNALGIQNKPAPQAAEAAKAAA
jgi:archaellum component FlaG (FlaF/FlaG flagellin family)